MAKQASNPVSRRHGSHWGAFNAHVRDGRVVAVTPFAKDPHPSPIVTSIPGALYDDSRIAQPVIRASWLEHGPGARRDARGAEPFVPVSWERALDLVATELERVKQQYGNQAIFGNTNGWSSAGRLHHAKNLLQRFLNHFGGATGQIYNYSVGAGLAIMPHIVGIDKTCGLPVTTWSSIAEHTDLMVMFGGMPVKNAQVTHHGVGAHETEPWLRRARDAGVAFVNVSPLREDTPGYLEADWIPLRPTTDTALMLGLAHTLATEGLHDLDALARYTVGYERFEPYLLGATDGQPKDADWAAGITDVDAHTIRRLARRMAAGRTMIAGNWCLQRSQYGEQPFWMIVTLAAMLGQIGLPGGGYGLGYGSTGGMGIPMTEIPSVNLPAGPSPIKSAIPAARIADMLLHPGEPYRFNGGQYVYPDIKLLYCCGANPFHHHQDLNRLLRAWQKPDTIIVHEPWWTATARHADIVLPSTTTLERNDIGASSRDRFILVMEQAIDPVGEARNDFDILADLAHRLGFGQAFTEGRNEMEWLRHLYEVARRQAADRHVELPEFEGFWQQGYAEIPAPQTPYVQFQEFRADPLKHALKTPSGKIEIYSETIAGFACDDCPAHPTWMEPAEWLGADLTSRYPLHLLSNQPRTRLHSQMDNGQYSRDSKIQGREPLWLNPGDAAARHIADGDVVRVYNDRGAVLAGAIVSDAVRPGVMQFPTGAWYDPLHAGTIGSLDKHGNPNVLTLDRGTSSLGQGCAANSTLVEVEKFVNDLPEITAFRPPPVMRQGDFN